MASSWRSGRAPDEMFTIEQRAGVPGWHDASKEYRPRPLAQTSTRKAIALESAPKHRVLVVDDEPSVRETLAMILKAAGHDVGTARDGFDALLQIKIRAVDVVVSDLNMPHMSGFEFLSVLRRRFPETMVIACSGAYGSGDDVPGGIIADAFLAKGRYRPEDLLRTVEHLIKTSVAHAQDHRQQSAPVWIPRNGKDSNGIPFIVLTCTECLRSFPLSVLQENLQEIQETPCLFCENPVRYVIDFSIDVASPKRPARAGARTESADGGSQAMLRDQQKRRMS
jgi:CheY-like chemotaxis protein